MGEVKRHMTKPEFYGGLKDDALKNPKGMNLLRTMCKYSHEDEREIYQGVKHLEIDDWYLLCDIIKQKEVPLSPLGILCKIKKE